MLMAGVCWCTYGGWNRDRDLQTGYSASGAAGDSMTRTVREFHQIDRNELVKSIKIKKTVKKDGQEVEVYISNGHGKGPNQVLLDDARQYTPSNTQSGGIHFEWSWPCSCKIYRAKKNAKKEEAA